MKNKELIAKFMSESDIFCEFRDDISELVRQKVSRLYRENPKFTNLFTQSASIIKMVNQELMAALFSSPSQYTPEVHNDFLANLCVFCFVIYKNDEDKIVKITSNDKSSFPFFQNQANDMIKSTRHTILYPNFALLHQLLDHLRSFQALLSAIGMNKEFQDITSITCFELLPIVEQRFEIINIKPGYEDMPVREMMFKMDLPDLRTIGGLLLLNHAQVKLADCDLGGILDAIKLSEGYFTGQKYLSQRPVSVLERRADEWAQKKVNNQADSYRKMYKKCSKQWKTAMVASIKREARSKKMFMVGKYILLARAYLLDTDNRRYEHIECFIDMGHQLYEQLVRETKQRLQAPTPISDAYLQLAELFNDSSLPNDALRCYEKAVPILERSVVLFEYGIRKGKEQMGAVDVKQDELQLRKVKKQLSETNNSLKGLLKNAFNHLINAWNLKDYDATEHATITIDAKLIRLSIVCNDRPKAKSLSKYMKQFQIRHHLKQCVITISDPAMITASRLERVFCKAMREVEIRKREIIRKLEIAMMAESDDDRNDAAGPSVNLLDFSTKRSTRSKNKSRAKIIREPKLKPTASLKKALPQIQWNDTLPEYHPTEGKVFPIPDPSIGNAPFPSGIFFGYIDDLHFDDENDRYQKVLAVGKFSNSDGAQGIRNVSNEDGVPEYYMFKINVGAHDDRLYGYRADTVIVDGQPRTLICFDQAVPHNKQLKPKPARELITDSDDVNALNKM